MAARRSGNGGSGEREPARRVGSPDEIKVHFLNAGGEGFSKEVRYTPGVTIRQLFEEEMPGQNPNRFKIRIRRGEETFGGSENPISGSFELLDGDRITCVPSKVEAGEVCGFTD